MIIIGEKLNSSIKNVRQMMQENDGEAIGALARAQFEAGAHYIDINTAMFMEEETEKLLFAVRCAMQAGERIMLDSPNADAIGAVLETLALKDVILNSITMEEERFNAFLPLIKKYNTGIVALPINDEGMPDTAEDRVRISEALIKRLMEAGVAPQDIYLDVLLETAATGNGPKKALESIRILRQKYADIHILCGLSNVSFGLPKREALNAAFLSAAVCNGLDSVIMDITNENMRNILHAAQVIAGQDEYCMAYIEYCTNEG